MKAQHYLFIPTNPKGPFAIQINGKMLGFSPGKTLAWSSGASTGDGGWGSTIFPTPGKRWRDDETA